MYNNLRVVQLQQGNDILGIGLKTPGPLRQDVPRRGLVGEWLLDGGAGDSSGYGNNGTPTNMTYSDIDILYQKQVGNFNGTNGYISYPNNLSLTPTGTFFFSFWFNSNDNKDMGLFQSWSQNTFLAGIRFWILGNNFRFDLGRNTGTLENTDWKQLNISKIGYIDGKWHHIVFQYTGSNMEIYINKLLVGSVSWTFGAGYNATTYILQGALNNSGSIIGAYYANCKMGGIRFGEIYLNNNQIEKFYKEGQKLLH